MKMTREQWLEQRRSGIGGSDAAAILGVSKWKSPLDVWLEKTGRAEETKESEAMYWGTVLEEPVARKYMEVTGRKIERCNDILVHPDKPFVIASVDRLVCPDGKKRPRVKGKIITDRGLEVKTANAFVASDWGESGTDEVPEYYLPQPMHYMAVTGCRSWDVAVLIGGSDFRIYHIERDDELIRLMLEAEEQFWHDHVLKDVPPPVDPEIDHKAVDMLYGFSGDEIVLPDEAVEIKARLDQISRDKKALDAEYKTLRTRLKDLIGDAEIALLPDGSGGYRRKQAVRKYKAREAYEVTFTDVRFSKKLCLKQAA